MCEIHHIHHPQAPSPHLFCCSFLNHDKVPKYSLTDLEHLQLHYVQVNMNGPKKYFKLTMDFMKVKFPDVYFNSKRNLI